MTTSIQWAAILPVWELLLHSSAGSVALGDVLCLHSSGAGHVRATTANLAAANGVVSGVAARANVGGEVCAAVVDGIVPAGVSGLAVGTASTVAVDANARMVRLATGAILGKCTAQGHVYVDLSGAGGAGGSAGGAGTGEVDATNPTFGAVADCRYSYTEGTNNTPPMQSALDALGDASNVSGGTTRGGTIYVPSKPGYAYRCDGQLVVRRHVVLKGDGGSSARGNTLFQFSAGVSGMKIQNYNSSTGDGSYSKLERFTLRGTKSGSSGAIGMDVRAESHLEDIGVALFPGDGVRVEGYVAINDENASNVRLENLNIASCGGRGLYIHGDDANVGVAYGVNVSSCYGAGPEMAGYDDDSYLGWVHLGSHINGCLGAAYYSHGVTAASVFVGCYSEADCDYSIIKSPACSIGGNHGAGFDWSKTTGWVFDGVAHYNASFKGPGLSTETTRASATNSGITWISAYKGTGGNGDCVIIANATNGDSSSFDMTLYHFGPPPKLETYTNRKFTDLNECETGDLGRRLDLRESFVVRRLLGTGRPANGTYNLSGGAARVNRDLTVTPAPADGRNANQTSWAHKTGIFSDHLSDELASPVWPPNWVLHGRDTHADRVSWASPLSGAMLEDSSHTVVAASVLVPGMLLLGGWFPTGGYRFPQKFFRMTAAPTSSDWKIADLCFFTSPVEGGYAAAISTVTGSPGTWKRTHRIPEESSLITTAGGSATLDVYAIAANTVATMRVQVAGKDGTSSFFTEIFAVAARAGTAAPAFIVGPTVVALGGDASSVWAANLVISSNNVNVYSLGESGKNVTWTAMRMESTAAP